MELEPFLTVGVILALIFSALAFGFALFAFIETQAGKRSTHTVMPLTADTTMKNIEDELSKITGKAGQGNSTLNRDLWDAGIDPNDLV